MLRERVRVRYRFKFLVQVWFSKDAATVKG